MGCGVSVVAPNNKSNSSSPTPTSTPSSSKNDDEDVEPKERNTPSKKWKEKLSKREARVKYMADGSIKQNSSDEMLELRVYLEDPVRLGHFGTFAKERKCLEILMCWADVLEFKTINKLAIDYKASQFNYIYAKYIHKPPVVKLPYITLGAEYEQQLTKSYSSDSFTRGNPQLPVQVAPGSPSINADLQRDNSILKNGGPDEAAIEIDPTIYDGLMQMCLHELLVRAFVPFKQTSAFRNTKKMSDQFNKVDLDDFDYMEAIGQGGYGLVVHVRKKSTQKHYAMKIQTKVGLLDTFYDCKHRVVQEKEAVASIHNPFIVSMDYAIQNKTLVMMLMDLGTGGTLNDYLNSCHDRHIPEDHVRFYTAEIVLAFIHMHGMGMLYRDLKPANVILGGDGHVKLVDLGGVVDVGGQIFGKNETADGLFADPSFRMNNKIASQFSEAVDETVARADSRGMESREGSASREAAGSMIKLPRQSSFFEGFLSKNAKPKKEEKEKKVVAPKIPPKPVLKRALSIMGTCGYMGK